MLQMVMKLKYQQGSPCATHMSGAMQKIQFKTMLALFIPWRPKANDNNTTVLLKFLHNYSVLFLNM